MFPDLLPSSAWGRNLRTILRKPAWDRLRRWAYDRAEGKCEACGSSGLAQGYRHALEAHEIWRIDDAAQTVDLVGIVALCPIDHQVAHLGRTLQQGRGAFTRAVAHMAKTHRLTDEQVMQVVEGAFDRWAAYGSTHFDVRVAEGLRALRAEGAPLTDDDTEGLR